MCMCRNKSLKRNLAGTDCLGSGCKSMHPLQYKKDLFFSNYQKWCQKTPSNTKNISNKNKEEGEIGDSGLKDLCILGAAWLWFVRQMLDRFVSFNVSTHPLCVCQRYLSFKLVCEAKSSSITLSNRNDKTNTGSRTLAAVKTWKQFCLLSCGCLPTVYSHLQWRAHIHPAAFPLGVFWNRFTSFSHPFMCQQLLVCMQTKGSRRKAGVSTGFILCLYVEAFDIFVLLCLYFSAVFLLPSMVCILVTSFISCFPSPPYFLSQLSCSHPVTSCVYLVLFSLDVGFSTCLTACIYSQCFT